MCTHRVIVITLFLILVTPFMDPEGQFMDPKKEDQVRLNGLKDLFRYPQVRPGGGRGGGGAALSNVFVVTLCFRCYSYEPSVCDVCF
jgi:hypothetical protein